MCMGIFFLNLQCKLSHRTHFPFFQPLCLEVGTEACPYRKEQAADYRRRSARRSCHAKSEVCTAH